jgi:hypothetical protein
VRNNAAYLSRRGHACFVRSLEASHKQYNEQHPEQLQYGPITVVTVRIALPGVTRSFLTTIAETRLRNGQLRLRVYHDTFTFISGSAEIELEATGFSQPVPSATEERLLMLLLDRAKSSKL